MFAEGFDTAEFANRWLAKAMPAYNTTPAPDPDAPARAVMAMGVTLHFFRSGGEIWSFDMLADLARIRCPTLVLGGDEDPITPIECQQDIAAAIPREWVRFERFADAGHGAFRDDPAAFDTIRNFILS